MNPNPAPKTPSHELAGILASQEKEVAWWHDYPSMPALADITRALERKIAVRVPDTGDGYKLSEKIPPELRVLEPGTCAMLEKIASTWKDRVKLLRHEGEDFFLVITSLGRTEEYQKELIASGYPAAERSAHTKLGAFDIATRWFEENRPALLAPLTELLAAYAAEGKLNFIAEPTIGVYHVARNPGVFSQSSVN